VEGRRFIDFAAGNRGLQYGASAPENRCGNERAHSSASRIPRIRSSLTNRMSSLAEKIIERAPGDYRKEAAFFTTGAEAVENDIKIARAATGRPGVIAFTGGFHGRTFMGMALTGKVAPYKIGFGPFPSDVFHAPFPNPLRGITTEDSLRPSNIFSPRISKRNGLPRSSSNRSRAKAVSIRHPAEFVRALRKLCDTHGILLIADEVQTASRAPARCSRFATLRRRAGPDDHRQKPGGRHAAVGRGRPRRGDGCSRAPEVSAARMPAIRWRVASAACGARDYR